MSATSAASDPGALEAARTQLARLGITPEQLLGMPAKPTEMPTLDDYVERVTRAVSDGARRAYAACSNRVRQAWWTRRLDEPTPTQVKRVACGFTKIDNYRRRIMAHIAVTRSRPQAA